MAALRVSGRQLSASTGIKHNYLAERLRDAKPFTLDDLDRILAVWDIDGPEFVRTAYDNHYERIWVEAEDIRRSASRGYELAAHDDEQHSIEDEQGGDEFP